MRMKLSDYAKQVGVTYKTAWQWWKAGHLDAYQLPTGTIIVREPQTAASGVALYARVSSADRQEDAVRQMQRLRDYAAARGYLVVAEVLEIASGLNDERPKLKKVLTNPRVGVIVVEHRDRLTRFGYGYITTLLALQGRWVEAVFPTDTGDEVVDDCVAVIISMAARLDAGDGRRTSKRRAEQIKACLEHVMHSDSKEARGEVWTWSENGSVILFASSRPSRAAFHRECLHPPRCRDLCDQYDLDLARGYAHAIFMGMSRP